MSCFNLSIIPVVPSNSAGLLILHLNVSEIVYIYLSRYEQGVYRIAEHLLGFASRKTKIPAIPQAPRRHGYKLLVHNTSKSEYYKEAARPVLRWRKANVGLGHVTRKLKPQQTRKPWQSSIDTYRWIFITSATQSKKISNTIRTDTIRSHILPSKPKGK